MVKHMFCGNDDIRKSLITQWLRRASPGHEMYCMSMIWRSWVRTMAVHQLAPSWFSGSEEHLRDIKHTVHYLDVMDSDPGRVQFDVLFLKWVHILFFTFYT